MAGDEELGCHRVTPQPQFLNPLRIIGGGILGVREVTRCDRGRTGQAGQLRRERGLQLTAAAGGPRLGRRSGGGGHGRISGTSTQQRLAQCFPGRPGTRPRSSASTGSARAVC